MLLKLTLPAVAILLLFSGCINNKANISSPPLPPKNPDNSTTYAEKDLYEPKPLEEKNQEFSDQIQSHTNLNPIKKNYSITGPSNLKVFSLFNKSSEPKGKFSIFPGGNDDKPTKKSNKTLGKFKAPKVLNSRIEGYLNYFQTNGRDRFSLWLSRSGKYLPMMKEVMKESNLPPDLVYLSMIESGFNHKARSRKGALGPWQFMRATGRKYGLRADYWIDERLDPEKSSIAAANYLTDLYAIFNDWNLALAGYNAGEGRVLRALRRSSANDFWSIPRYSLPRETRNYVPKMYAALIIAKDPKRYGFHNVYYEKPIKYEKVSVPPKKRLKDIAKVIGANYQTLVDLNPSLLQKATPPGGDYELKVPFGFSKTAKEQGAQLASLKNINIAPPGTHRVRRGDTLGGIARLYSSRVSSIKRANNIRGSLIRIGQVLTIPGRTYTYYPSSHNGTHTVRKGESLSTIAKGYGVKISDLRRINNINGSLIRIGQNLKIPTSSSTSTKPYVASSKRPETYNVVRGDTLGTIARRYNITTDDLRRSNNISGSNIKVRQKLKIPGLGSKSLDEPRSYSLTTHRVRSGETLGGIANRYNISTRELRSANNIRGSLIRVGQTLTVPINGSLNSSSVSNTANTISVGTNYVIKSGDSPYTIANNHGISVSNLMRHNNINDPKKLRPGQIIFIPTSNSDKTTKVIRYKIKNGDTLSHISKKFNVSLSDIKKWNNMNSSKLVAGADLLIYVD